MKRCQIALATVVACLALFSSTPVFSTWNKVLSTVRGAYCGFFFNEFVGFVGSDGFAGIFKTTDGGNTWVRTTVPSGYHGRITQIFMKDALNGWATIEETVVPPKVGYVQCLFKTVDGGLNWIAFGPSGYFSSVYQTPNALILTNRAATSSAYVSTDNGLTFQPNALKSLTNGVDFVDDLHGVATGFEDSVWQITQDGGKSWTTIIPPQKIESWGVYGVKGTNTFYASPETDQRYQTKGGNSSIYRSTNYGATWTSVSPLTFYSTGQIEGFNESVLYVQEENDGTVNNNILGIYRSTDKGQSWQSVGGPSNTNDTRFVVTGCNGGVIYAFDGAGNVWKSRDGGDGQIYEPPVDPQISGDPIIFSGPICSTSYAALKIENFYCLDDTILSAEIVDSASSDLFTSGALSITVSPKFPLLLAPNTKDSVYFTWQPSKLFHSDTTTTFQVKVRYFSKALGQTFDKIVTVSVHAEGEAPRASITPHPLDFGKVPFCLPHDSSFVIHNLGCDTLFVLNVNAGAPVQYLILDASGKPLQLPLQIAPSDSLRIIIRLTLNAPGNYSSDISLKLRHQGIGLDTTINILGSGFGLPATFISTLPTDTLFNLNLTRCDTSRSFSITLSNPSCVDKVTIRSAGLQGNLTPNISLSLGSALPSDLINKDTVDLRVNVTPKNLGSFMGQLHIVYEIGNTQHDTTFSYFLKVGYGSRILSVDHDTVDLGSMRLCDSKDSSINAKDLGCDSLSIVALNIFGNGNFALTGAPQLDLASNQSSKIPFHFDPIGAGDIIGTLTVTAVSDSPKVKTVYIIAHVIPTDTMSFNILSTRNTFHAGDTLTVRFIPQSDVHNVGLNSLAFTLNYNGDLLTLLPSPAGVTTLIPNAITSPATFGGTPKHTTATMTMIGVPTLNFDKDTPALQFQFQVSLTDSLTTTFDLTDIQLNGGSAIYQRCTLGIVSASPSYELALLCGDSTLVKFLQLGNNIKIFAGSVYPNPISGQTNFKGIIPFTTAIAGSFGMKIFDQFGRMVTSQELLTQSPGKYQFTIDGKDLAAGCYSYLLQEISNSSSAVRGRFIIAK